MIATYGLYLLPYVGASYDERYGMPPLGLKVFLVVWAADRLLAVLPRSRGELPAPPLPAQGVAL